MKCDICESDNIIKLYSSERNQYYFTCEDCGNFIEWIDSEESVDDEKEE